MSKHTMFPSKDELTPFALASGTFAASLGLRRDISLEVGVYAMATFLPLGSLVVASPQSLILPVFIIVTVAVLVALEAGGWRVALRPQFWVALVLSIVLALAIPVVAWPEYPIRRVFAELGQGVLLAGFVATLLALSSHLLRAKLFRLPAGSPGAFVLHGTALLLGSLLIDFRFLAHGQVLQPGGALSDWLETLIVLLGNALAVAAVGLVLLHLVSDEGKRGGPLLMRLRPVWVAALAAFMLFGPHELYTEDAYIALLLALPLLCMLPFATRSPILASICLAAGIALLPFLPVALAMAYAPGTAPVANLAPLVGAVLVLMLVLALRRATMTRQLLNQNKQLDGLHARFVESGAGVLLFADLKRKQMLFPGLMDERQPAASFADFFRDAPSHEMLTLLAALNDEGKIDAQQAFPLHLHEAPNVSGELDTTRSHRVDLFILEKARDHAWLGLIDRADREELEMRTERAERALAEALVREERLLTVASHELRTPMSVLAMLSEELDDGTSWAEVAPGFRSACERINSVLDDLRVRDSSKEAQMLQTVFTLREMAMHLQEVFTGPAQANGVALLFSLSQRSDTLLRSDYGRVFIALSKLIHNAIIHARATEISISAFLTVQTDGVAIATWQVSDNGRGIPAERCQTIFRPFDTDGKGPSNRPGLGLYTARKAIEAMGGQLNLRRPDDIGGVPRRLPPFSIAKDSSGAEAGPGANPGATFVLKFPARLAEHVEYTTLEHLPVTESQATYPDKTVLLVEDNLIVGDIMVVRLRRLFGTTIWAERGDEALLAYEKNHPDLLLVDQLLPGKLGSEIVQYVRETDREVPIVGITASAMGSECAELEAAGANYALEKPLSMQQMKKIALEFFGEPVVK